MTEVFEYNKYDPLIDNMEDLKESVPENKLSFLEKKGLWASF